MTQTSPFKLSASPQFWVLAGYLALIFLIGGGARSDIQSLVFLRPIAALAAGYGLWSLSRETARAYKGPLIFAGAVLLYVALQLVPLPPFIWSALPGRELLVELDRASGLSNVWRPISMAPTATWNALYSLLVPISVLILMIQLTREERFRLLPLILGFGLLSGLIGILQIAGPSSGPLYFYDITNNGFAVGLFANRNHAAFMLACSLPVLAIFASTGQSEQSARFRTWSALIFAIVLLPLILVTGSRAGLALSLAALVLSMIIYRRPDLLPKLSKRRGRLYYIAAIGVVFCITATFALASRATALQRLLTLGNEDDLRFRLWAPIVKLGWQYFPVGSGIGSFVETFQIGEPDELLTLNYANHAHNDWLELWMTGGAPALAFVLTAVIAWSLRSRDAWLRWDPRSRDTRFARLGSIILLLLAAASLVDYPLRAPSLACIAVVASIWLFGNPTEREKMRLRSTETR